MSLYLRLLVIILQCVFADIDDDTSTESAVVLSVNAKDLNVLGRSLAKQCGWHWIKTDLASEEVSWDARYEHCDDALQSVQKKYKIVLSGDQLSLPEVSEVERLTWYQPEYHSVAVFKKQLRAWLSTKVIKTFGFFEESGVLLLQKEKKEMIELMDVPPKQVHLRAVLWVTDQKMQSHLGFSPETIAQMPFDQWLEHVHWMQGEGSVKVLAQPELFMVNNKKAVVYSGEEIPYVSADAKRPQVLFKKALLSLTAKTSHIGEKGASLEIEITFDKASENQYHGNVGIARQMVKTSLRLPFHTLRVMGGVRQHRQSMQKQCLPVISVLPMIGPLFCETSKLERQSMLYVLLMISPVEES